MAKLQFLPVMGADIFEGGIVDYTQCDAGKIRIRKSSKFRTLIVCPYCSKIGMQTFLDSGAKIPSRVIHIERLDVTLGTPHYTATSFCENPNESESV